MNSDKEYPEEIKNECGGYYCSEEHGHIDCVKHDHTCHCGAFHTAHETGDCFREMCYAPLELQNDFWEVEGVEITGYTLREQRMYHRHPCGCWSRSKCGSTNSIDA